ncbi:hypothetical protein FG379_002239 [Cryptosporidium bovis]|uniref:uncharacterized protein n=1 Tax=Cryptosporidium bovis TaxID=310047 RepID=UPI003519E09A|nr:hypothetical protein FG379_002239 [Cryptosporidium bovis]
MESVVDIKNESGSPLEDVLYFRLIKLIYSIKDISETIVELIINIILFLMVLFKWVFQFNTYITSLFKFILNITSRISGSITFENKIYILVGTILIYLLIRITNKLNEKIKLLKRKYNNNWSIVINQIIYVFSPYIIFILFVYLPLCVIIPEYYFENLIVKIWILWIPMNKAIISLYNSLLLNIDFSKNIREDDKKYIDKFNKFIYICKKFSNTDIVLNFLEYISNGINYNKNTNLSLLNSKNFSSSKVVNVKALQCWGDYFGLWLTYSFLKSYIIGDGVSAILKLALSHIKVMKIILINVIKKLIFKEVKIIKYVYSIKYISIVIKKFDNLMIFPIYLFKTLNILVVNLNWKCLIISIIVLNILLQIKYHEIYDCKFSMLVESELKCNGNTQDEESGDDMDEYRNGHEEEHNSSSLIIYEYPSLILIIRNHMIHIIDCFTVNIFGITLFGHIHQLNESNRTGSNPSIYIERLNRKEYTRSIPLISKHSNSDDNRKSSRALLHSRTMPELNIGDKNISMSKFKIIASIIDNNILLNWLPDGIKKYYLNIGEKLMGKSNKFKYWILFIIVFVCQIPQWIILLFPPFIVNAIGCMLFGFVYPLIMILKINCSIYDDSKIFDKKLTQKIQTWTIYLLTFNLINEILNIVHFDNNILTWIPFKGHFYYLMILTLQLISSLIPVIIEQNI